MNAIFKPVKKTGGRFKYFAVFAIFLMLLPAQHSVIQEYAAPFAIIVLFILAVMHFMALFLLSQYSMLLIPAGLLIPLAAWIKKRRGAVHPAETNDSFFHGKPSLLKRAVLAVFRIDFFLFISGVILTGFILSPDLFRALVWTGLLLGVPARAMARAGRDAGGISFPAVPDFIALAVTTCLTLLAFHEKWNPPPIISWLLCIAGAIACAAPAAAADRWKFLEKSTMARFVFFGFFAGVAMSAGFTWEVMSAGSAGQRLPERIGDSKSIYDLEYEPLLSRLYITTGEEPGIMYINPESGETAGAPGMVKNPERIAVFPSSHSVVVGGRSGVMVFFGDLKTAEGKISERSSIDIEKMGEHTLLSADEGSGRIIMYDMDTEKEDSIILSGFPNWPYSIKYSPEAGAAYVGGWIMSPFVHRIDSESLAQKRIFNGFMNMGMCVDYRRNRLLVSRPLNRRIDILDAQTLERKGDIPIAFGVREIECDSDKNLLFALDHFQGILYIKNMTDGKTLAQVTVGGAARAIAYDPAGGVIYVGAGNGIFALELNKILQHASIPASQPRR